jgi:hypothetical protein
MEPTALAANHAGPQWFPLCNRQRVDRGIDDPAAMSSPEAALVFHASIDEPKAALGRSPLMSTLDEFRIEWNWGRDESNNSVRANDAE